MTTQPVRVIHDAECIEIETKLIEHIDQLTGELKRRWARGLYGFLVRDDYPRHGCQTVGRTRDGEATAPTHSSRRWVAASLYNFFGLSRVPKQRQDTMDVHVEPIFRMPGLKVYTGLIYNGMHNDNNDTRDNDDHFQHDNFQP